MFPDFDHAFVVTIHAIYSLARLGEDKFVDAILANFAFEAVGMIRIIARHDRLIKNGQMANIATVRAVCTYRRTVGEKQEVCVGSDSVCTFRASEAVDMEERLTEEESDK